MEFSKWKAGAGKSYSVSRKYWNNMKKKAFEEFGVYWKVTDQRIARERATWRNFRFVFLWYKEDYNWFRFWERGWNKKIGIEPGVEI